jgi:hypothetical protein
MLTGNPQAKRPPEISSGTFKGYNKLHLKETDVEGVD